MSEFLTPEQVAERIQVTAKTVRDWLRNGDLVGVKLGRSWRIKESDLERMIENQRVAVLVTQAQRKHPRHQWTAGRCEHCQDLMPVPNIGGPWVCSKVCKVKYDENLATLVDRSSVDFITGSAKVIPPF